MEGSIDVKIFKKDAPKTTPLTLKDASFSDGRISSPRKDASPAPAMAMDDDDKDFEISIFDAKKYYYFNNDQQMERKLRVAPPPPPPPEPMSASRASVSPLEGYRRNYMYRAPPFQPSPAACSEACSHSEFVLCNAPGAVTMMGRRIENEKMMKKNVTRSSIMKWFFYIICGCLFRCPWPCLGRKDEEVGNMEAQTPRMLDHYNNINNIIGSDSDSKSPTPMLSGNSNTMKKKKKKVSKQSSKSHHDHLISLPKFPSSSARTGFSFPIIASPRNPIPIPLQVQHHSRRGSLEIFRPSDHNCIITHNRKSTDNIPPPTIFPSYDRPSFAFSGSPPNPPSAAIADDEDMASDASSDLFEIESLTLTLNTTDTNYSMHRRRESLELEETYRRLGYCGRSLQESTTPTEYCYEPSEASIDWSVTTAEGFDRRSLTNFSASALDMVDDVILMRQQVQRLGNAGFHDHDPSGVGGTERRRENGIFMSCRCGVAHGLRR